MSFRAKRLIKKIISWSGLFFFALAAYMLYRQLSKYHLQDILDGAKANNFEHIETIMEDEWVAVHLKAN